MDIYINSVKKLANGNKESSERANLLIKEMCQLTQSLLDYNYTIDHYNGNDNSTVVTDRMNTIKNSMAVLISEMDIYAEQQGFYGKLHDKKEKRVTRLADKI